jgi:hypothetical protein
MEIAHAHIVTKPNTSSMDFQWKIKVNNILQHINTKFSNKHVVRDLICCKGVSCQKSLWFKKGRHFSFSLSYTTLFNKNNLHFLYKFGCSWQAWFFKTLVLWFLL